MPVAMPQLCDLQIHINGQHTFIVNEETVSNFLGKLTKIINQERKTPQITKPAIEIYDFPGGPDGFELISRFCYNNGTITITVSNVSVLHCCALFLEIPNLLQKTETFLEGMFYWSWSDIITCLKSCENFFNYADSSTDLVQKLMRSLIEKISPNSSDLNPSSPSSSSSASDPFTLTTVHVLGPSHYNQNRPFLKRIQFWNVVDPTHDDRNGLFSQTAKSKGHDWWFNDLTILPPEMIKNFIKTLGGYRSDNNSLLLTRFLLHYLKKCSSKLRSNSNSNSNSCGGLADTAVHGVINLMVREKRSFSCRGLFSVMRVVVGGCGLSRCCRNGLEKLIGGVLDEATLDDLLVCGPGRTGQGCSVYDVNLVLRLVKVFVHRPKVGEINKKKMKNVGRLIDDYLGEIAPDQNLNVSKFLAVAESLPDFARGCFDGVYRAIDIYLESHPSLSLEERSRLCRCVNYEKLSLEACKELAKNPRIPPRIAVRALVSQHPNIDQRFDTEEKIIDSVITNKTRLKQWYPEKEEDEEEEEEEEENPRHQDMRLNLERMQWRVVELEKECRQMKSHMSRMVNNRALPRLC